MLWILLSAAIAVLLTTFMLRNLGTQSPIAAMGAVVVFTLLPLLGLAVCSNSGPYLKPVSTYKPLDVVLDCRNTSYALIKETGGTRTLFYRPRCAGYNHYSSLGDSDFLTVDSLATGEARLEKITKVPVPGWKYPLLAFRANQSRFVLHVPIGSVQYESSGLD